MRILYTGQFDACCVGLRQKKYLAELGVDFRIAVERIYWPEALNTTDWWIDAPIKLPRQSLEAFSEEADLVIYCPSLAQEWSCDHGERVYGPEEDRFPVDLKARRKLALFHGSINLAEHAEEYARVYRAAGWEIAATTLDYV